MVTMSMNDFYKKIVIIFVGFAYFGSVGFLAEGLTYSKDDWQVEC